MKKLYFLLFALFIGATSLGQTTVFINEIHYDNSGGDVDEGVEIAGPAGTDLSTYTITAYNGNNGSSYNTVALSGIIPDEGSGYGAVWFPISGLQNGAPDGIALDNGGSLIQFLSYEGSFTASGGAANGSMSTDIGVAETSGTAVGQSLQLTGSGTNYEDFIWSGPSASSNGSINTGQTFGAASPTISATGNPSFFYFEGNGPSGEDTISVSGVNLDDDITVTAPANFEVSLDTGGPYSSSVTLTQNSGTVDPTDIYIIMSAGLTQGTYTGDVTASSLNASDQTVSLNGTVDPADPLINTSGSIADQEYNFGSGPSFGDSFSVSALFLQEDLTIDAPADFEVSLSEMGTYLDQLVISPDPNGEVASTDIWVRLKSGLVVGSYSGDVTMSSFGATNQTQAASGNVNPTAVCAPAGSIIITEIMQNPSAQGNDPAGEYFEIYNSTASPIDLAGWVIRDDNQAGETHTIATSLVIAPGEYLVIGNVATAVPTLDYNYGNDISLGNSTDGILIECGIELIDQVIWDNGATFPDPTGASMELSSTLTARLDNLDNNDGSNWGVSTTALGNGDFGTPGTANSFALSVDDFDANTFSIYPNPTNTGEITISTTNSGAIDVIVYDMLGKQVQNETISNNRLNVANLKSGIYLLRLTQNGASSTKKLVVE